MGGRRTDLDLLIQKVQASTKKYDSLSTSVDAALRDIVVRTVTEIRKVGLFEDSDTPSTSSSGVSTASLGKKEWTPVQFWKVVQLLCKFDEVSYDELRYHPVFKGNEGPIQAIERAGLITCNLQNGKFVLVFPPVSYDV